MTKPRIISNMDDLMAAMKEVAGEHDENCPECAADAPRIDVDVQALALRNAFAVLSAPKTLKPGDLIRGRKEFTHDLRNSNVPHMLLEYISEPFRIPTDEDSVGMSAAARLYDCIILQVKGGGKASGGICHWYADSREWEPYPDADKLMTTS